MDFVRFHLQECLCNTWLGDLFEEDNCKNYRIKIEIGSSEIGCNLNIVQKVVYFSLPLHLCI